MGALRGGTYVASAQEMVKAPTLDAAHEDWSVSTEHMQDLVLRSDFVFPEPPIDEASGCGWMPPQKNVTVSCRG